MSGDRPTPKEVLDATEHHALFAGRGAGIRRTYEFLVRHSDYTSKGTWRGHPRRAGWIAGAEEYLAEQLATTPKTVRAHLRALNAAGLIVLWRERNRSAGKAREFIVVALADEATLAECEARAHGGFLPVVTETAETTETAPLTGRHDRIVTGRHDRSVTGRQYRSTQGEPSQEEPVSQGEPPRVVRLADDGGLFRAVSTQQHSAVLTNGARREDDHGATDHTEPHRYTALDSARNTISVNGTYLAHRIEMARAHAGRLTTELVDLVAERHPRWAPIGKGDEGALSHLANVLASVWLCGERDGDTGLDRLGGPQEQITARDLMDIEATGWSRLQTEAIELAGVDSSDFVLDRGPWECGWQANWPKYLPDEWMRFPEVGDACEVLRAKRDDHAAERAPPTPVAYGDEEFL